MRDTALAKVENLAIRFATRGGDVAGVEDVSFDITPGETLCIVGESGSGKSVTALSLMRLEGFDGGRITSGQVHVRTGTGQAVDLADMDQTRLSALRGKEIGMVFQEPMTALNPVFTIGRQLAEGVRLHDRLSRRDARTRVLDLMRQVRIPDPERRIDQYPHELSGGLRQRVVIAMALACRPKLLIADEPTTALDVTIQADILALLDRLKQELDLAVLLITHDMAVVAQMADRVVVMRAGRVVEAGPVKQIFEAPQQDYTKALLAAVPRLGAMQGAEPNPSDNYANPLLDVRNLCVRFDLRSGLLRRVTARVHAVEGAFLTIGAGRTLSLVGESGCGKSTVARAILRLTEPDAGEVMLDGTDILGLGPEALREARRDMQMVFQDPYASLDPKMKIAAQVAEPLLNYENLSQSARQDRVAELFDQVQLPRSFLTRYPHELSGGQRQRVAIARALALNPKLIIADEAVSALDVSVQAEVLALLQNLQNRLGLSYLFISHDMAVVEQISHDVAVMYLGRIVECGPRAAIFGRPQHPYTKALLAAVPVADPSVRQYKKQLEFRAIPSPIHPVGHQPPAAQYRLAGLNHYVLTSESGYE